MDDEAASRWIDSMSAAYERGLVPTVFRPFAVDLAARAVQLAPRRVLELAAGTGVLTSEVLSALPNVELVATDFNDAMVAVGSARASGASWRMADAMDLPFDADEFDLVLCQFGAMFFPDQPVAFAEVRRVLASDGTFLLNVWGAVDAHDFQAAVIRACDKLFPEDPPVFMASVPHYYADADLLVADLRAGGLDAEVETVVFEGTAASASDIAAGYCFGTPVLAEVEARGGDPARVVEAIAAELTARLGPEPITGRMQAHVVRATVDSIHRK